jgi:hypothetical protein
MVNAGLNEDHQMKVTVIFSDIQQNQMCTDV